MQRHVLFAAMLSAGLLAACGGGGGDSSTPAPDTTPASVSVTGVAAKGLMRDAKVTAHAIKADGSIDETPLGDAVYTDADGNYTLSFPGSTGRPYVVRVQAVNEGGHNTKHLDEATGTEQALPSNFTMRAVITPAAASDGTVTTSASVTPFSELAVAAAAKASGGVTSANVAQAVTTVTTLLGFDPTNVVVKAPGTEGATSEQKKLALMLTAVSKLADSELGDSLGCADKSGGEKTQCVVSGLASAASATSIKLESGNGLNVSALLGQAVNQVLADPALSTEKGLDASLAETVKENLACTTNCTAPTPTAASAVAAAKALIDQLKSDWTSLFSSGGATATAAGAFNQEAFKFQSVASAIEPPLKVMATDVGAMVYGVALYREYTSGGTTQVSRGDSSLGYARTDGTAPNFSAIGCTLYAKVNDDGSLTEVATSPTAVAAIGCRASYFAIFQNDGINAITSDWRHGFTLLPQANGTFTYTARARKRVNSCVNGTSNCTLVSNAVLQTNADGSLPEPFAGTITPRTDAAGTVNGALITGTLPGAINGDNGRTVVNHHHDVNLDVTVSGSDAGGSVVATGSKIVAYKDATTELDRLELKTGTFSVTNDAQGNTTGGNIGANLVWTVAATASTNGTQFDGVVKLGDAVRDKSGKDLAPTSVEISGALRNIASGGAVTEFLSGKFTASTTGYANYDKSLPASPTNSYGLTGKFVGTLTATNRPTLEVTVNATQRSHADTPTTLDAQYRVLVNGAPRSVVSLTTVMNPSTGANSFSLNEAASGLKLAWTNASANAQLTKGSDVVGVYAKGVFTFVDNSFVSLDLGL